jgi:cytochrome bd-type quinol oxidase subunit 2
MLGIYDTDAHMSVFTVLLFYPFCFTLTLTNELLKEKTTNGFFKALIRYIVFLLAVGLFICFPHRQTITGTVALILFFAFTILYVLAALLNAWLFSGKNTENRNDTEYTAVYKNVNRK